MMLTCGKAYATECTPSWAARIETNSMCFSGTSWSCNNNSTCVNVKERLQQVVLTRSTLIAMIAAAPVATVASISITWQLAILAGSRRKWSWNKIKKIKLLYGFLPNCYHKKSGLKLNKTTHPVQQLEWCVKSDGCQVQKTCCKLLILHKNFWGHVFSNVCRDHLNLHSWHA